MKIRIRNPFKRWTEVITKVVEKPYTLESALNFITNTISEKNADVKRSEGRITQIRKEISIIKTYVAGVKTKVRDALEVI